MIGTAFLRIAIGAGVACASAGCSLIVSDGAPSEDDVPTCPTAFSLAGEGACLINASAELYCWGHSLVNATGSGVDELVPTRITGLDDVRDVHVGEFHACAVHGDDGRVSCWGRNDAGQVGDGTSGTIRTTPTEVVGITDVVMVRTGQFHTCAVHGSDRRVRCWGDNDSGELGDGTFESQLDATGDDVPSLAGVVELAVSDAVTCALEQDRTVDCWGTNIRGELGVGTTDLERATPSPVIDLPEVEEISGGCHRHLCTVDTGGLVWCWGDNMYGQLASDEGGYYDAPRMINLPTQHVAVGGQHTCAVHDSGEVYCWGSNLSSQLGSGTPDDYQAMPGPVASLPSDSATVDVEAGCLQSCVRRVDGGIWCWGSNEHGELGDGSTVSRLDPAPVQYECR